MAIRRPLDKDVNKLGCHSGFLEGTFYSYSKDEEGKWGGFVLTPSKTMVRFTPFIPELKRGDYVVMELKSPYIFDRFEPSKAYVKVGNLIKHQKAAENSMELEGRVMSFSYANSSKSKRAHFSFIVSSTGQCVTGSGIFDKPLKSNVSYVLKGYYSLGESSLISRSFNVVSFKKANHPVISTVGSTTVGKEVDLDIRKSLTKKIIETARVCKDFDSFCNKLRKDKNIICQREYSTGKNKSFGVRYYFEHDGKILNIVSSDLNIKTSYNNLQKLFNSKALKL